MEIGTVIKSQYDTIEVAMPYKELCSKCNLCTKHNMDMIINVKNTLNAKIGDKVKIETEGITSSKAAIIIYLIPLFFMFTGYMLGYATYYLTKKLLISIIIGILIFSISFLVIRFCENYFKRKIKFVLIEIIR